MVADAQLLACRFLVIANGMAACYSLLQGARCLVSILTGGVLINRPMAWAIFSCDQASIYDCHYQLLYIFGRCIYVLVACVICHYQVVIVLLSFLKIFWVERLLFCSPWALEHVLYCANGMWPRHKVDGYPKFWGQHTERMLGLATRQLWRSNSNIQYMLS